MQVATRSESKKLIKMKRITKNGALVTDGGEKCDPKKDCIFLSQFFIYIIIEVCLQICKLFTDNQHKCDAAPTASNMDKD